MFQSTVTENFESWDNFLDAYYQPIRTALRLIPFVGESRADDLAQSFFLKMYERDVLDKRPAITGKFRNWLYVAARRHAVDEWRKTNRRPERTSAPGDPEPVENGPAGPADAPFDADEFYALSILHLTVERVRKHLIEEGKSEHWMIFEEMVLAPLIPGRIAKTREELLAMFPGQPPGFLDNRVTTVKRVFRRILPALVPADPTENLTPEQRFQELLEILHGSKNNRLWLVFLTRPVTRPDESTGSSQELTAPSQAEEMEGAMISPEVLHDELRVLRRSRRDGRPTLERRPSARPARPGPPRSNCPHSERPRSRHALHNRDDTPRGADRTARTLEGVRKTRAQDHEAGRKGRQSTGRRQARKLDAARDRSGHLRSRRRAGANALWQPDRGLERRAIPEKRRLAAQSTLA
jgi:DNA-directed RNA polymerase specialized sigma24 family protein